MDFSYDSARIKGKTILITGGASGFGAGFAARWAAAGANVVIGDLSPSGEQVAERIRKDTQNPNVHFIRLDVTSWPSQVNFFRDAVKLSLHGGIDTVVSNAGINNSEEALGFENPTVDYFNDPNPLAPTFKTMDINLTGMMYTVHLALFYLPRNPGSRPCEKQSLVSDSARDRHILLLGSVASLHPLVTQAPYTVTKHGVLGLFRCLRISGPATAGVRVNMVCPYFTDTPFVRGLSRMIMAGIPMGKAEDVVDAATFLVADTACLGRSLVTGPRMKLLVPGGGGDGLDGIRYVTRTEGDDGDREEEGTVWECYLHDLDTADIFTQRMLAVVNAAGRAKGWGGWAYDMAGAMAWVLRRWWSS